MHLKTCTSLNGSPIRRRVRLQLIGFALTLAAAVALGACGDGGQTAATQASAPAQSAPATQASTQAPTPRTTTTPTATAPAATASPAATAPATTQPPARTRPPKPTASTPAAPPSGAATTPRKARSTGPTAHPIKETARLVLEHKFSITHYRQTGTVSGTFAGTMALDAQLGAKGVAVSFSAQLPGGSVTGHGLAILQIEGAPLDPLTGTATITGGTGTFAHAHARGLKITGRAALDGSKAVVSLAGSVVY